MPTGTGLRSRTRTTPVLRSPYSDGAFRYATAVHHARRHDPLLPRGGPARRRARPGHRAQPTSAPLGPRAASAVEGAALAVGPSSARRTRRSAPRAARCPRRCGSSSAARCSGVSLGRLRVAAAVQLADQRLADGAPDLGRQELADGGTGTDHRCRRLRTRTPSLHERPRVVRRDRRRLLALDAQEGADPVEHVGRGCRRAPCSAAAAPARAGSGRRGPATWRPYMPRRGSARTAPSRRRSASARGGPPRRRRRAARARPSTGASSWSRPGRRGRAGRRSASRRDGRRRSGGGRRGCRGRTACSPRAARRRARPSNRSR